MTVNVPSKSTDQTHVAAGDTFTSVKMATLRSRLSSVFTDNVQNHWASCDKELELFAHRDFTRIFSPSHQIDLNHANWKRKKTEKKTKKTCSLHVTCSSYHNVVCSPWQSSCKGKKATQWIKFLHLYCTSSQFSNPPPKKKKKKSNRTVLTECFHTSTNKTATQQHSLLTSTEDFSHFYQKFEKATGEFLTPVMACNNNTTQNKSSHTHTHTHSHTIYHTHTLLHTHTLMPYTTHTHSYTHTYTSVAARIS